METRSGAANEGGRLSILRDTRVEAVDGFIIDYSAEKYPFCTVKIVNTTRRAADSSEYHFHFTEEPRERQVGRWDTPTLYTASYSFEFW